MSNDLETNNDLPSTVVGGGGGADIAQFDGDADEHLRSAIGSNLALRIIFDDGLYNRAKQIANLLANGTGTTPKHLLGQPAACFNVVVNALTWKLSPFAVAMETYETPGGKIGYQGALVQAILERSGRFVGGIKFKHYGDWEKLKGTFKIVKSDRGKDMPQATWTREMVKGIGVEVIGQVKGEVEPRSLKFDLDTAFPLNSTLWATRPHQQICYTAVRAFARVCAPSVLLGIPMVDEDDMEELNPRAQRSAVSGRRPQRGDYVDVDIDPPAVQYAVDDQTPAAAPPPPADPDPVVDTVTGEVATPVQQTLLPQDFRVPVPATIGANGERLPNWPKWAATMETVAKTCLSLSDMEQFRDINRPALAGMFKADPVAAQELVGKIEEIEGKLS